MGIAQSRASRRVIYYYLKSEVPTAMAGIEFAGQ